MSAEGPPFPRPGCQQWSRPSWSPIPVMCFSYLLPHLLPSKPGLDTHGMRHPTANTIQRVFKMSFVPVGFWQRFIARMLISLAEMDLQVTAVSAGGGMQGTCRCTLWEGAVLCASGTWRSFSCCPPGLDRLSLLLQGFQTLAHLVAHLQCLF
jgi:hypothetical protein